MATFPVQGDLRVTNGRFALVSNESRLLQRIRRGLALVRGSWKYDGNQGVPWFDGMLDKGNPTLIEANLRSFLASFPEVVQVFYLRLRADTTTRIAHIEFKVLADTGEVLTDTIPFTVVN